MFSLFSKSPSPQVPQRTVFVNLPERVGPRMDMSELKAALEGNIQSPAVRAILQLMHYRQVNCSSSAKVAAYKNQPAKFDLGGAHYLDELFGEVVALIDGQPVPDGLKEWFDQPS